MLVLLFIFAVQTRLSIFFVIIIIIENEMDSSSLVKLPYYAPSTTLPAPLPSILDIHASSHLISHPSVPDVRTVVVAEHFVVKYGNTLNLMEAQNMLFVTKVTSIPVPRVYAVFTDHETSVNYIIMQRIRGRSLKEEWQNLTADQKRSVCQTLKSYVVQLRRIPSPAAYCSVGVTPLLDLVFCSNIRGECRHDTGPFSSNTDFNEALFNLCQSAGLSVNILDFYRRAFPFALRAHPPTFSHANFRRENIIIRKPNSNHTHVQLTLLSWRQAGWYPRYWEYTKAVWLERWRDDWEYHLSTIMKRYAIEASWINMMKMQLYA